VLSLEEEAGTSLVVPWGVSLVVAVVVDQALVRVAPRVLVWLYGVQVVEALHLPGYHRRIQSRPCCPRPRNLDRLDSVGVEEVVGRSLPDVRPRVVVAQPRWWIRRVRTRAISVAVGSRVSSCRFLPRFPSGVVVVSILEPVRQDTKCRSSSAVLSKDLSILNQASGSLAWYLWLGWLGV